MAKSNKSADDKNDDATTQPSSGPSVVTNPGDGPPPEPKGADQPTVEGDDEGVMQQPADTAMSALDAALASAAPGPELGDVSVAGDLPGHDYDVFVGGRRLGTVNGAIDECEAIAAMVAKYRLDASKYTFRAVRLK